MMDGKTNGSFSEYLSELCMDFDESTLISICQNYVWILMNQL